LTAGAGKTFLTSKVIDHIESLLNYSQNHEGFAFFYCNRNDDERRKPVSVLRSYALNNLLSQSKKPLKIFISSRPDGDIRDYFSSWPTVEIQATHNQSDIEKFVHEEIVKHRRWSKMQKSLQRDIVTTFLGRSTGMFQWAYLQIEQLLELRTESAIRDRLGKLPAGLKDAYDEIYGNIARNKHDKVLADRVFMWQNVWRFSHLSVTEYFEDNHWRLWQAHSHAAKVCLMLLIETY
ncbi:hypothetical protein GQ53DRAFT_591978, partial [Thozetella sp. PMI_491]